MLAGKKAGMWHIQVVVAGYQKTEDVQETAVPPAGGSFEKADSSAEPVLAVRDTPHTDHIPGVVGNIQPRGALHAKEKLHEMLRLV